MPRTCYPLLEVNLGKIRRNTQTLNAYCGARGIPAMAGVFKFSDGDMHIAKAMFEGGCTQLAASRPPHLRLVKEQIPGAQTLLLRLPMLSEIDQVVAWCDLSLNSQRETLLALNEEALRQNKTHGVILMLDVGDLREGVVDPAALYALALLAEELPGLHLTGVGSTFTCFGSILPTAKNLGALLDAARRIEAGIGRRLEYISGGSSSSLIPLSKGEVPRGINHLRIGSAIVNPISSRLTRGLVLPGLEEDAILIRAEIVEVETKPSLPFGDSSVNWSGQAVRFEDKGPRKRAILALGSQDIGDHSRLIPKEEGVTVLGGSSDHTILDVEDCPRALKTGDILTFASFYAPMLYSFSTRHVQINYL